MKSNTGDRKSENEDEEQQKKYEYWNVRTNDKDESQKSNFSLAVIWGGHSCIFDFAPFDLNDN